MVLGYITEPKRGSWGGTITPQSLRILRQLESKEPKKRRKRIDSLMIMKILVAKTATGLEFGVILKRTTGSKELISPLR